ncbi:MAG: Zn-dependent hydrolase, partial [Chloroflexi bacterium]|nr:Zn-dependent hydrolase [Chloroflexota bacterium]
MTDVRIEAAEMQQLIETLGAIGEQPGGGIIRHVYSPSWVAAREQLERWMNEAGLQVREDAVGNLFGRIEGESARTVLTGSHVDTVVLGGRYDGALGVLSALAALRALRPRGKPRRSLEMVVLCEEEDSRFHANFWGTRGILGLIDESELRRLVDSDGVTIAEAMQSVGLDPARYREARRTDLDAFIELHIEQGRILYDEGLPLGIVDTITGLYRFKTTVVGRTDHAGTTPMDLRRDALQAAVTMSAEMTRLVSAEGRPAVVTNGWWNVQPGAWNIVPGHVEFSVDLRHPHEDTKQRLASAIRGACERIAAERGVTVEFELASDILPCDMHADVKAALVGAADEMGVRWKPMV